jgi:uncharacterized protein YndB with AHSA1/START domain
MELNGPVQVSVSRSIAAPAAKIFQVLADPANHPAWEPTPGDVVASRNAGLPVGASQGYSWGFRLQPHGDSTIVTEVFDCTEADKSIRDAVEDGQTWVRAMHTTLDRLAAIVS